MNNELENIQKTVDSILHLINSVNVTMFTRESIMVAKSFANELNTQAATVIYDTNHNQKPNCNNMRRTIVDFTVFLNSNNQKAYTGSIKLALEKNIENLKKEIERIESIDWLTNVELKKEIDSCKSSIKQRDEEISVLENKSYQYECIIKEHICISENLKNELKILKNEYENAKNQIACLKEENDALTRKTHLLCSELENIKAEIEKSTVNTCQFLIWYKNNRVKTLIYCESFSCVVSIGGEDSVLFDDYFWENWIKYTGLTKDTKLDFCIIYDKELYFPKNISKRIVPSNEKIRTVPLLTRLIEKLDIISPTKIYNELDEFIITAGIIEPATDEEGIINMKICYGIE